MFHSSCSQQGSLSHRMGLSLRKSHTLSWCSMLPPGGGVKTLRLSVVSRFSLTLRRSSFGTLENASVPSASVVMWFESRYSFLSSFSPVNASAPTIPIRVFDNFKVQRLSSSAKISLGRFWILSLLKSRMIRLMSPSNSWPFSSEIRE